MKWVMIFIGLGMLLSCERFPSAPEDGSLNSPTVFLKKGDINYIDTVSPFTGLVATKVNLVDFRVSVSNFEADALEFYGNVVLNGPPDSATHSIHFRTDLLSTNLKIQGYTLNTLDEIKADTTYRLFRAKFPTNEYAPFAGTQGMILSLKITHCWAYLADGSRVAVVLSEPDE